MASEKPKDEKPVVGRFQRWFSPGDRLAAVSGALMALAFPPFPLGFLAYGALGLGFLAAGQEKPPIAFRRGFIFGFTWHLAALYWVYPVTVPGAIALATVLGLYVATVFAVFAYWRGRIGRRAILLIPFLWITLEYLRSLGALAFPWTNLSMTQVKYITLVQFADITSDLGVGFWVATINIVVWSFARRFRERRNLALPVVSLILLFLLPYAYGSGQISEIDEAKRTRTDNVDGATLRVAVLQGNINSFQKWDSAYVVQSYQAYETLSRLAVADGAELIIWPETAAPGYLRATYRFRIRVEQLSRELRIPLLIGTLEYESPSPGEYIYYNAAVRVRDGHFDSEYHAKMQLVPFGEWIPFSDRVKILKDIHVGQADFTAGHEWHIFDQPNGNFGALICFECAFPELVRGYTERGARWLVNITNDGWYGITSGPYQHLAILAYRAIENRVPIARAANTGISAFLDPAGRVIQKSKLDVFDYVIEDLVIPNRQDTTFFTKQGLWFAHLCIVVLLLSAIGIEISFRLQRRKNTK